MSHKSSLSRGHRSHENERKKRGEEKVGSIPADRNTYPTGKGMGISITHSAFYFIFKAQGQGVYKLYCTHFSSYRVSKLVSHKS
jgi:hypothetical protein